MSAPLAPGLSAQLTMTVTRAHSADTLGNTGVAVFATPFLIAFLKPYFEPGGGSVGTMVDVKHLAATPLGMSVRAQATILEIDGKRVLFAVEAWDEVEKIAEGRHERFIVPDLGRFLERAAKKGKA